MGDRLRVYFSPLPLRVRGLAVSEAHPLTPTPLPRGERGFSKRNRSAMATSEPRNPLYLLLLLVSLVFVITALAYAVIPILEEKALQAGEAPPPSPFRQALRQDGWRWLLYEVAAMIVVGVASMALDRRRQGKNEMKSAAVAPLVSDPASLPASQEEKAPGVTAAAEYPVR
jgi:hypothetical protein